MTIEETDACFARAYASAIKNKLQLKFDEYSDKVLFLSPIVQRGIPGGDLIYPEMTNLEIYSFADALLSTTDPCYIGGAGGPSYIQDLKTYVDYIYTKIDWSPTATQNLEAARKEVSNREEEYSAAYNNAMTEWRKEHDAGATEMKFWAWAQYNAMYLDLAGRLRNQAYTSLDVAAMQHYGPQADELAKIRNNLRSAMETNSDKKFPGFNQMGLVVDKDLIAKAIHMANGGSKLPETSIKDYIVGVPNYQIAGYNEKMNEWMRLAANGHKRDQIIIINVSEGKQTCWSDYGYEEVDGSGSQGIFPFLSALDGQTGNKFGLNTEGRETDISLTIAAIGLELLSVTAGRWDVPNIKTRFPKLVDGAPDVLSSRYARPISVLVGYDVTLTATFGHSIRNEAKELYDKAKNTGGSIKIFGFEVSRTDGDESSERINTNFEGVKWDDTTGSITLTPDSKQVYPSVLAVVGQRLIGSKAPGGPSISSVFGTKVGAGIDNLVYGFSFSEIDVKDNTKQDYLHVGLAPAYGKLTSEAMKTMDKNLKVMISGTLRLLEKKRKELNRPLSWDDLLSTLMQNPLIDFDDSEAGSKVDRTDKLIKPAVTNFFKISGAPDPIVVREVETWFTNFIGDQDILDSTVIDIKIMARIVAQTGATIDSVAALIHKIEHHEKTLVDIGVLRFPDPDHPYFKIYRIRLTAWSVSSRYIAWQEDSNGITGELNVRHFRPRKSIIDEMKKEVKDKAVEEAENIFS